MTSIETSIISEDQQQEQLQYQQSNSNTTNNEGALKAQNIQQDTIAHHKEHKERKRSRSSRKHKKEKDHKHKDSKAEKDKKSRSRSDSQKKKKREKSKKRSSSHKSKSKKDKEGSSSRHHHHKKDKKRDRSSSRRRHSSRSKRDKSKKRHESSKRKRRHSSSQSSGRSSSDSRSKSRGRGSKRSGSFNKKKLSEADLRRLEREKRNLGEYYSQMKASSKSKERKKKGKDDKFIDSNNMQIDTEKFFWDGFAWQPRINKSVKPGDVILQQTEKMRKIQLQNVPVELGLDKFDIISYVNHFMKENHLANEGNDTPIINCEINEEDRTANIEFASVEETNLMYKLGSFKFFQTDCKLFRICDNHLTQPSMAALTQQAIRQAEVAAQIIKATESLFQDTTEDKNKNKDKKNEVISNIIKVTNTIELGAENTLTEENWEDLHADLIEEFERYGEIGFHFIIRPYQATVGAKAGTLFIEYVTKEAAQTAIQTNQGRAFNQQILKIFSISEEGFRLNFRPLISVHQ